MSETAKMLKFIVTLSIETDAPLGARITRRGVKDAVFNSLLAQPIYDAQSNCVYIKNVRVRTVDVD